MRKWLFVLSAILVLGVLAACGSNGAGDNAGQGGDNNEEASLEDIFLQVKDVIIEDLEEAGVEEPIVDGKLAQYFEIDLTESGDEETEFYLERLGIEEGQLEAGYFIAAMMNVNSNQIIMLEAKDESEVDTLKETLEAELAAQVQTWEMYLPDQHEKVKNNVIKQSGNKLIYITYDQPDKITEIFDANTN